MLKLNTAMSANLADLEAKEWLLTNGLGGYASSTIAGMNTRRYHGLLVAATTPPAGRILLLSKVEEVLIVNGVRIDLSTNRYANGVIHPEGYRNLKHVSLDLFPVWSYSGPGFQLTKTVFMVQGSNATVIEYALVGIEGQAASIELEVRPFIAFRDHHSTTHQNSGLDGSIHQTFGSVRIQPYRVLPSLFIAHNSDVVSEDGYWYKGFEYAEEKARGLDYLEDLYSPLSFRTLLDGRKNLILVASTEPYTTADAIEMKRTACCRDKISGNKPFVEEEPSPLLAALTRAAQQFVVARPPFKSLIAGYHWFGDWGRDTMIALPGLLLCTGQPETAREILLEFHKYLDGGMLPNRFPERGEVPEYNTVDATLWYFEAIWQYLNYSAEPAWKEAAWHLIETVFYPSLKDIAEHHLAGTRYGIRADEDGFLWAGNEKTQLTWMDAKVGDIAITPRAGRPVEIQALWYNALKTLEEFGREFGDDAAVSRYSLVASRLLEKFEGTFWNASAECLFDVAHDSWADPAVRPNQVIAISLRHCMMKPDRALAILSVAELELLTPFGLRTLSPFHPEYRGTYAGDVWSRDSAYHQGTVWPWLVGPFFSAKLKFAPNKTRVIDEIDAWLGQFSGHLDDAGLGQVSEIFDGDFPHRARGCIAQAWSVSELLRLAKTSATHRRSAAMKPKSVLSPRQTR